MNANTSLRTEGFSQEAERAMKVYKEMKLKERKEISGDFFERTHRVETHQEVLDSQSGEEAWQDYLDLINHIKKFMHDTSAEVLENITINDICYAGIFPTKERLGDISTVSGCLTFTSYPTRDQRQYNLEDISDASELLLGKRVSDLKETNGREIRRFLKPRLSSAILRQYEI